MRSDRSLFARVLDLLLSQGLGVFCGLAAVVLLAVGSVVLTVSPGGSSAGIQGDDLRAFFEKPSPWHAWLYLLAAVLALYALNVLLCTVRTVWFRLRARLWSPSAYAAPLMHLSFLLALLAHLIGGLGGAESAPVFLSNAWVGLGGGIEARLQDLSAQQHADGSTKQIDATVELRRVGNDGLVPDAGTPGAGTPGVQAPGAQVTVAQAPGAQVTVAQAPGAGMPDAGTPGVQAPGVQATVAQAPGAQAAGPDGPEHPVGEAGDVQARQSATRGSRTPETAVIGYNGPLLLDHGRRLLLLADLQMRLAARISDGRSTCTAAPGELCELGGRSLRVIDVYSEGHWGARPLAVVAEAPAALRADSAPTDSESFFLLAGSKQTRPGGVSLELLGLAQAPVLVLRDRYAPGNPWALAAALVLVAGMLAFGRRWWAGGFSGSAA